MVQTLQAATWQTAQPATLYGHKVERSELILLAAGVLDETYWRKFNRRYVDMPRQKLPAGQPDRSSLPVERTITKRLLRTAEAANWLGTSDRLLRELVRERKIPFIQLTERSPFLFDVADLDLWTQRSKQ